ncbi:histidine utilization repressor [Rhodoferax sp.]|uniref:histidine utilization repressor n=1 Tax=Rhodoferax sp. TaxID=50421 RepID=UPI0025EBB898|nr:histidine utilization repressor [Rhodoferax sp.]MCM2295296.1 histidine utilization repressor [Rhodoferax sp.]MDD3936461.1 histidine utilization repressor [Rhodoferax sp.]
MNPSNDSDKRVPAFQRIKAHVLGKIHAGHWKEGDAIPAEEALAREFGVSRMTVNRAIRELSDEQIVERVQGSGTYVAQQKYHATLVEIRNIADEIAARGHVHRSELHRLERLKAGDVLGRKFGLPADHTLYHSVVVHFENDQPIQVEDRFVNPVVAPDYLQQDFSTQTPNAYLMRVAPLQAVHFVIEACSPPANIREMLRMTLLQEPCLLLHRQTQSMGQVASIADMWHPATRYRFTGSF